MSVAVATERPTEAGHLDRLELLCDPGTLQLIRTGVVSPRMGERARPDDGVLVGGGQVGGRPVFCYAQDPSYLGGSLGGVHADSIVRVMELARRRAAPVVGFVESGGARLQEGHDALAGYGRILRASVQLSRIAPQITVVSGVAAGGGAYSPALTDFVVMTEAGRMFLTGPKIVRAALGEEVGMKELGGPDVHGRNGVAHFVVESESDAAALARDLLGLLSQRVGDPPPAGERSFWTSRSPRNRATPSARGQNRSAPLERVASVPSDPRKVYDVREVARTLLDEGELLEESPSWAANIVTGLGRIEGQPVAVIANQPRVLAGVIDAAAAEKAARFVEKCDRFRLPLVVLVDTPGFMPGLKEEAAGVIRRGAGLLHAFAGSTVPKLTVVLRKAFGGAVITMNSRDLGADAVFAWPGAEIGIMAARQAVDIVHRKRLAEGHDDPELLASAYAEEHLGAEAAAATGFVDEVIEPESTRDHLARALAWRGEP